MSAFFQTADLITARLAGVSALSGVTIITERQRDLDNELRRAAQKQAGVGLLVVAWTGGNIEDDPATGPRFASDFTVTGFFKPVIRRADTPADSIMETIAIALHDWIPGNGHGMRYNRVRVQSIRPMSHPELLVYQMSCKAPTQLPVITP